MNENVAGGPRRVLAIGVPVDASTFPVSALAPDGQLILMESDPARADEARRFFSTSTFAGRTTVIGGDPRRMLYKLAGPFDLIVCDAAYLSARETLERLLAPNGILVTNDVK
jgi:predicted O-methyltransferase YrrM